MFGVSGAYVQTCRSCGCCPSEWKRSITASVLLWRVRLQNESNGIDLPALENLTVGRNALVFKDSDKTELIMRGEGLYGR